ncbi:hypothetical protein MHU86_8509 [Fragilaria crotonensis]|nr:hypothetical protein MHU86_8509 [Fragilaria crotonensis]
MNKKWQNQIVFRRSTRLLRSAAVLLGSLGSINSQSLRISTKQGPTNPVWDNLLDVASPEQDRQDATPLFWHIHKAGGTTLHDFLSSCLNLTIAAEVGVLTGHQDDQNLAVMVQDGRPYINIDTTTDVGILHAHNLGFQLRPHVANVVISPLVLEATQYLFTPENKAMLFAMMRHPVSRAISQFYYIQGATWEPTYDKKWASMTLMDYIKSDYVESNWMVRFLVGKPTGSVDENDLEEAKSILRQKCWIGLQARMRESVDRFGAIFGWTQHPKWSYCVDEFQGGRKRSNSNAQKLVINRDREEWALLSEINALDMELFALAHRLFHEQTWKYFPEPSNGRF